MSATSRLNTTFSNQTLVAHKTALYVLVSVSVIAATAITYSGHLAKTAYSPLQPTVRTSETSAQKTQTVPQPTTLTVSVATPSLSLPSASPNIVTVLQPAPNYIQTSGATAETLQPTYNVLQPTGNNLQNAEAILQ